MASSDVKRPGRGGPAPTAPERIFARMRGFLRATRGGATAMVTVAVVVMTIGASTIMVDHNWLVDQRDVLKSVADASAIAATVELERQRGMTLTDAQRAALLAEIANTYAMLNLQYLTGDRLAHAVQTLTIQIVPHPNANRVEVSIESDLGGTLLARHLPFAGNYGGPEAVETFAAAEMRLPPVEVVLAIDVSLSMQRALDGFSVSATEPSRMDIVKTAAKKLVETLEPNAVNRVAVAVLPWHVAVRLPAAFRIPWETRTWARFPTSRHYPAVYECQPLGGCTFRSEDQVMPPSAPEPWRACVDETRVPLSGHAEYPNEADWFTLPSDLSFAQAMFPGLLGTAYDCWRGRTPPADFFQQRCYTAPRAGFRLTPQPSCPANAPHILPLSTDEVEIEQAIDALVPMGVTTYSALGVLWGQRLLSHDWKGVWNDPVHPVDPALPANRGLRKAVVLLTDGQDNKCGGYDPYCRRNSIGIARSDACDAVKAEGTELFVVAAIDGTARSLADDLLACSSQAQNPDGTYAFLDHENEESLVETFTDIADQLRVVRRTY